MQYQQSTYWVMPVGMSSFHRGKRTAVFVVRTATEENPLYKVDDSVYARFSERNNMFKRLGWDPKARIQIG